MEGKEDKPNARKLERGEGVGGALKQSVLNTNYRACRRLSGLIGFVGRSDSA